MGQFKKLVNMTNMQVLSLRGGSKAMVDINGASKTIQVQNNNSAFVEINAYNTQPFGNYTGGWGMGNPIFYASSNRDIPYSQTSLLDVVGTTTRGMANTNSGWTASVTVTSESEVTIRSLLVTKNLFMNASSSGSRSEFLIFAYILDNPITLNAENNYTANIAFAVAFD